MELKTSLYLYQQEAVDKLLGLRIGALYMEMGTGKTRTALEIIKRRVDAGKLSRVLWLCPCSVKGSLNRDIDKHASGTEEIRIEGIESLSASARLYEDLSTWCDGQDTMLIVDESNLVKNHRAIRSRRIVGIAERCKYRMILNGTPISKSIADMYNQWYILDWRVLGYQSFWSFAANHLEYDERIHGRVVRALNLNYLMHKIAPYTYQARKEDHLQLPEKSYTHWYFSLDRHQEMHYHDVAENLMLLLDDEKPSTIYRLLTAMQLIACGRRITSIDTHLKSEPFYADAGDDSRLDCLLDNLQTLSDKVIIFCRYSFEIHRVTEALAAQYGAESVVQFYGELPLKAREASIRAFEGPVRFLVANRVCAGYGLNLQFCHQVVYYSNDWDFATRIQSEDRVHRIGQDEEVNIYDIYAEDTIDERIMKCLLRKENLVESFKDRLKSKNREALRNWVNGTEDNDGESLHTPERV